MKCHLSGKKMPCQSPSGIFLVQLSLKQVNMHLKKVLTKHEVNCDQFECSYKEVIENSRFWIWRVKKQVKYLNLHISDKYNSEISFLPLIIVTPWGHVVRWQCSDYLHLTEHCHLFQHTIDLLKMDIEFNEWTSLLNMLEDGVLRYVKQLSLEIHTPEVYLIARPSTKEDFVRMYEPLLGLEKAGFRKFHFTYNSLGKYTSSRTGKLRTCCYELYYININFLKFWNVLYFAHSRVYLSCQTAFRTACHSVQCIEYHINDVWSVSMVTI